MGRVVSANPGTEILEFQLEENIDGTMMRCAAFAGYICLELIPGGLHDGKKLRLLKHLYILIIELVLLQKLFFVTTLYFSWNDNRWTSSRNSNFFWTSDRCLFKLMIFTMQWCVTRPDEKECKTDSYDQQNAILASLDSSKNRSVCLTKTQRWSILSFLSRVM